MLNSVGMHHCFLNVVIQSLWHLTFFRERFIRLEHHTHVDSGLRHDYVDADANEKEMGMEADQTEKKQSSNGTIKSPEQKESAASSAATMSSSPPILDDATSCICCALQSIMVNYEHSDASILPPGSLRYALSLLTGSTSTTSANVGGTAAGSGSGSGSGGTMTADPKAASIVGAPAASSKPSSKFGLGEMSDAEEALEEILAYLHHEALIESQQITSRSRTGSASALASMPQQQPSSSFAHLSNLQSLDTPCNPPCISHRVFGIQMVDQRHCMDPSCRASSDPELSNAFLYRFYVDELLQARRSLLRQGKRSPPSMEEMLRMGYMNQTFSCPAINKKHDGTTCKVSDGRETAMALM